MNSLQTAEETAATSCVLDASALLAAALDEPGRERVLTGIRNGAAVSAVNLAEVATRLMDLGFSAESVPEFISAYRLSIEEFSAADAWRCATLRPSTRSAGLSLGDRACLALAERLRLPALTADRAWRSLDIGVHVEVIR